MRAHGATNFPDPSPGGGFQQHYIPGIGLTLNGVLIDSHSPAVRAAAKTCDYGRGGSAPPPLSESQKQALVQFSQCMREHGVPNYPDPRFPAGYGIGIPHVPGLNRNAPAVQRAAATCNRS